MTDINSSNESLRKSDSTVEELNNIRQELEHLQNFSLNSIWEQTEQIKKENNAIHKEILFLKANLVNYIAIGVVIGYIVGTIVIFVFSTFLRLEFLRGFTQ